MDWHSGGNRMILASSVLGAFVFAVPYAVEDYRIVCNEFVDSVPAPTLVLLGIIGFTMGMAWLASSARPGDAGRSCGQKTGRAATRLANRACWQTWLALVWLSRYRMLGRMPNSASWPSSVERLVTAADH
jgi:hypothetical protein